MHQNVCYLTVGKSEFLLWHVRIEDWPVFPLEVRRIELRSLVMSITYVVHQDERSHSGWTLVYHTTVLNERYRYRGFVSDISHNRYLFPNLFPRESDVSWLWKSYHGKSAVSKCHLQTRIEAPAMGLRGFWATPPLFFFMKSVISRKTSGRNNLSS